jgi:hypothetical protein
MRKKASRRSPSRRSTTKPTARRTLEIAKETIRTLGADDLTQVVTGIGVVCPNSGETRQDTQMPPDHNKR